MLPVQKRGKGCQPDQNSDEQAITESALNELVGAAAVYNLEVRSYKYLPSISDLGRTYSYPFLISLALFILSRRWSPHVLLCVT